MLEDIFKAFFFLAAATCGCVIVIFGLCALWAWTAGPKSCESYGRYMGLKTTFDFWNGCFVEMPNGEILPKDIANKVLSNEYQIKVK